MSPDQTTAARTIAQGVHWLGGCMQTVSSDEPVHFHISCYLIVGSRKTVLVDTGDPRHWELVSRQLTQVLGDRPLDYVFPTHPELPHAGNLPALLTRYPAATVVGDVRDYHVHFPEFAGRFEPLAVGEFLELGDRALQMVPAYIYDLHNTLWAYETGAGVLFVCDGFGYIHDVPAVSDLDFDEPVHRPGQCRLMSGEMPVPTTVDQAAYGIGRALYWTRFVDVTTIFGEVERLLESRPTRFIAPSHGNVIDDVETMFMTSLLAHRKVYESSS